MKTSGEHDHDDGEAFPLSVNSITRPPEHGVVAMHRSIVLAPAARQAARSCVLCGTACAGLLAGSLARGLLSLIRAFPRQERAEKSKSSTSTRASASSGHAMTHVTHTDMGMRSMSLASK